MKCHACGGSGVIRTASWYNSDPPDWAYAGRQCWRCYGSGYL